MSMMMIDGQSDPIGFRAGPGIDLKQALVQGAASLPEPNAESSMESGSDSSAPMRTGVQAWLWQAGQTALLSQEQEVYLAQRIESAREREDWREERRIKERLIAANLRLVANIARRYNQRGLPVEDLMQEGTIGLMRAVERFDWRKGHRFSTYAVWWIRQSILRALAEQSGMIRLPAHILERVNRIYQMRDALTVSLGRVPSQAEIAEKLGMSEAELGRLVRAAAEPKSLESPISEESRSRLADTIEADETQDPIANTVQGAQRAALLGALDDLNEQERKILLMRYGLAETEPMTVEETSRTLRVSRERVYRIEAQALKKLRRRISLERLFET